MYKNFLSQLNEKVIKMFPNNPSIKPIKFEAETYIDQNIKFEIKLLKLLVNKPTSTKETFSPLINKDNLMAQDPFLPPFEVGVYIDELTDTHSLIFNKFSISDYHVIIITKEF